jgi:hypothetical protein
MRRFAREIHVLLAGAMLALTVSTGVTRANFINDYCGNTRSLGVENKGIDGTFSFGVVDLSQNDALKSQIAGFTFMPGTGSTASLDTSAHYLYLYQVVNDGVNSLTSIDDVTMGLGRTQVTDITSWGYFRGVSLADIQGAVGQNNGLSGGRLNALGDADNVDFTELSPASTGVTSPGFVTGLSNLQEPLLVRRVDQGSAVVFKTTFDPIINYPAASFRSTVFGFTSNVAPAFDTVNFQDLVGQGMGTVVAPVPEPATWASLLALLPLLVGWMWRNRRRAS